MHFEQSLEWARFQQALGRRVFVVSASRLDLFLPEMKLGNDEGIAVERDIAKDLHYLEVNGWMPISGGKEQAVPVLKDAGEKIGAVFVRWTPGGSRRFKVESRKFVEEGVVVPRILVHQVPPRTTLVIGLSKSEEALLAEMHEKTRYNIRLAERKGVEVRRVSTDDGFDAFWGLMQETAARDKIGVHPREYYLKMIEAVQGEGTRAHLFLAIHAGKPLATAILIIFGETATYLHGGSSSIQRNLMAPHLLQWRMIQWAKQQGCMWYDMWGVAPGAQRAEGLKLKAQGNGTWTGITRFKMGFGGEVREGQGTLDIICRPFVYNVLSLGRRLKRAF